MPPGPNDPRLSLRLKLAAHHDHVRHAGLEARPLPHAGRRLLARHVPQPRHGLGVKRAVRETFALRDPRPRAHAAALDRIPRPRAPRLGLTLGAPVEPRSGVVRLLDEPARVGVIDDIPRLPAPGKPHDRSALRRVEADLRSPVVEQQQRLARRVGGQGQKRPGESNGKQRQSHQRKKRFDDRGFPATDNREVRAKETRPARHGDSSLHSTTGG
jgi:hypothetical protein